MKNLIFEKDDIKKNFALALAVLACLFRLFLSYTQYATIYPPLAPLDDDLMFKAAQSIVRGKWLGDYTWLTISKHAFFAVWLAFLHKFNIPFLVGNMSLWIFSCMIFIKALNPAIKKNWLKLFCFLGLVYNPAACASYATRVYRDSVFPAFCLLFFRAVCRVGLRYKESVKKWLPWLSLGGVSFGLVYLTREDGIWVLPFFAIAFILIFILLFLEKDKKILSKLMSLFLPVALAGAVISGYCYMNYRFYGRFIVSDFQSKEFKSAYGALTSLEQDNWKPLVAVPKDVRADVRQVVPSFADVNRLLSDTDYFSNGYYSEEADDYNSGSFYWALRKAIRQLGYYKDAQTAKGYYENLTAEIQRCVDSGELKTANGKNKLRVSVTPPIKGEYVLPILAETFKGFGMVITFGQCDPSAERAVGKDYEIARVRDFINREGYVACVENTDIPYLSPIRRLSLKFMGVMISIYKVCMPIMLLITFTWQIKKLIRDIREKKFDRSSMLNIILLGLIGMAFLRCAMIGFMEVSSFAIGTYVMYLSTVHPLVIAYGFLGFAKTFEK